MHLLLPPHHLILLRMLRLLQKIAPPLGAQLGERQLEQPTWGACCEGGGEEGLGKEEGYSVAPLIF